MLYSLKKETGYERPKYKSTKKLKNLWDNTHLLSPNPHPDMNQPPPAPMPPPTPTPPIIHSNDTMDTEILVQMRKSNKCGSVPQMMKIQLTLGIWCGPLSQHPLPSARHQPHLLIPSAQTINQKKAKNPEMRFNSQQMVSYCLGLHTQNPRLRGIDLEPRPQRGSDKINMLK